MAREFGPHCINENVISPISNSPGIQEWMKQASGECNAMVERIPLRGLGELESDLGRVTVFLAYADSAKTYMVH